MHRGIKKKCNIYFLELVECKPPLLLSGLLQNSQFKTECMFYVVRSASNTACVVHSHMHVCVYIKHLKMYGIPSFGG